MKKIYFLLLALGLFTSVNAQIINFPDANFKVKLLQSGPSNPIAFYSNGMGFEIDTNNNGEIEETEALNVTNLRLSNSNIISVEGINYFRNLRYLYVDGNQMSTLSVTDLLNLRELNCNNNQLASINLVNLPRLAFLDCINNQLVSLNLPNLPSLRHLECSQNQISSLDLRNLSSLTYLYCNDNLLTEINVNENLNALFCSNNQLNSLDLSDSHDLRFLNCSYNPLTFLFLKNNSLERDLVGETVVSQVFNFSNIPNLRYICADDFQIEAINNKIIEYAYTNCHVNSYCSFTPGGTHYTIQGNSKFDENNNGCDMSDLNLTNLRFNITNGSNSGIAISNDSGNYSIPVQAGAYTITPVLENPSYFNVSPSTVNVTFPAQASPFNQDFCVAANGVHPDLEIAIIPINAARPGFEAMYKLVYKNKGNTTQSGTVNLNFNDAVLDFVEANPVVSAQTVNNLSWNFSNLLPFETREIIFTVNVNSPMETPAVNGGDILTYTATISSPVADEIPSDNTFVLNQTVFNAYDPNDKICLEGNTITPDKAGEYVHYMIRFENTGTANAQNIVVKDMIDTAKFDIASLVPMKGSHSFVTNITSGNKVEFIFENINLPFDDANNDGYVAFKIKTVPTLVNGDTFSNSASIYFDYNFPIVTNTATTTIAALNNQDFEFSNYFRLYPNPVHDVLNITTKETITISSVSIYNTLGQLVVVIPNAQNTKTIDVSNLTTGNYFIKINSDKGTSNTKFIKQ